MTNQKIAKALRHISYKIEKIGETRQEPSDCLQEELVNLVEEFERTNPNFKTPGVREKRKITQIPYDPTSHRRFKL